MEMMEIKNLSFQYTDGVELFSGRNFSFKGGEVVLIKGPSGRGKSTLAGLMAGHLLSSKGEILLDGKKISGPGRDVLVVHQENDLFPWLTAHENLELLKKVNLHDKSKIDFREELKEFGLLEAADLHPSKLSGGMKRRLAILRGLLMSPKVLILDESMSSLDEKLKLEILSKLKQIVLKKKMVLIIIDHNTDTFSSYIDQTIEL